jgi:tetratricopeptide (TPR) repeat protein
VDAPKLADELFGWATPSRGSGEAATPAAATGGAASSSSSVIEDERPLTFDAAGAPDAGGGEQDPLKGVELRETQVARRVRYKKFISDLSMAYNRYTMRQMSLFDILGVPVTASQRDIRRAYERLRKKYDLRGVLTGKEGEKEIIEKHEVVMRKIKEAYSTLIDPKSRREYMESIRRQRRQLEERKQQSLLLFHKAMGHYKEGDFAKARELLNQALALDSNNPVFYNMLDTMSGAEKSTESEKYFQVGVLTFTKRNDLNRAVLLIKKAISMNPNYRYYHKLGEILSSDRSRLSEAIEAYEKAREKDPGNVKLLTELANLAMRINRKQDAVDYAHEALRWDEENREMKKLRDELMKEGFKPKAIEEKEEREKRRKKRKKRSWLS